MAEYPARTPDNKCVFCEIVAGNVRETCFWENADFVAFLSIDPNTPGFSCVVPKAHFGSDILKMPNTELQQFILAAKEVAKILENYYEDVGRVGLIMEGTGIDHAHIKLVPMHGTAHMKEGVWRQYHATQEHWFDTYEGWLSSAGGPMGDRRVLLAESAQLRASYAQKGL